MRCLFWFLISPILLAVIYFSVKTGEYMMAIGLLGGMLGLTIASDVKGTYMMQRAKGNTEFSVTPYATGGFAVGIIGMAAWIFLLIFPEESPKDWILGLEFIAITGVTFAISVSASQLFTLNRKPPK